MKKTYLLLLSILISFQFVQAQQINSDSLAVIVPSGIDIFITEESPYTISVFGVHSSSNTYGWMFTTYSSLTGETYDFSRSTTTPYISGFTHAALGKYFIVTVLAYPNSGPVMHTAEFEYKNDKYIKTKSYNVY